MTRPVIVGGGLAGAAAATLLAQAGRAPIVLERERGPRDKICGEFLSSEAQNNLTALGLDVCRLGGAPTGAVRIISGKRTVERRLPFVGLGLTRKRLDEALLNHAERLGAEVRRGVAVRAIGACAGDGLSLDTGAGLLGASQVLLASGKHDVRGVRRETGDPGALGDMLGFKSYFRLPPAALQALDGHVEVVLFNGGYAGLQRVEDGLVNLCLVAHRAVFDAAGRNWPALFGWLLQQPHLGRRLGDAEEISPRPLTVADVPYGYIHRRRPEPVGLWRLGDQAVVIPSFSGDGMAIALHSARLAAQALIAGHTAASYHQRLRSDVKTQVRLAVWLQHRAEGWPGRDLAVQGLALLPGAVARLAAWTRVSDAALRRTGLTPITGAPS